MFSASDGNGAFMNLASGISSVQYIHLMGLHIIPLLSHALFFHLVLFWDPGGYITKEILPGGLESNKT